MEMLRINPVNYDFVTANLRVVSNAQVAGVTGIAKTANRHFGRFPDVIGCQEAIQLQSVKEILARYQVLVTDRPNIHDNTNVVLIKKWFEDVDQQWFFGAPPSGDGLNHRERHFHVVRFTKRGHAMAHVNAHLSVIREPQSEQTRSWSDLVKSHAQMSIKIADEADTLRKEGRIVSITADSNDNHAWPGALYAVLEKRGYLIERNGIDMCAIHRTQARRRAPISVLVGKDVTHSDHEAYGLATELLIPAA